MTKNAKICPALFNQALANARKSRFAAFHISSIDMSIISGLRRSITPATPMKKMTAERPI